MSFVLSLRRREWATALCMALLLLSTSLGERLAQAQRTCPIEQNRPQEIVPLMHNLPLEGTVRSTSGEFGAFDTTQYTIDVPSTPELNAGQAQLRLELLNLTNRSRDIDLIVRVGQPVALAVEGSSCLIQADYFARSDIGEERLTIDVLSEPPLQAATYYIAVLNFEFDRPGPQDYRLTAQLVPPPPPLCPECFLVPGESRTGAAAPQSLTPSDQQFLLEVPNGTRLLALSLTNQGAGMLNLHIRVGHPVEADDGTITADFSLYDPSGPFFISGSQLKGESLIYLAVENQESFEQPFALMAILVPNIHKLKASDFGQPFSADTTSTTILDERLQAIVERQLQTGQGRLALTQYAISVSHEIKGLRVELAGEIPDVLRVHIRLAKPVEIADGRAVSDLSTSVKELSGSMLLTGGLFQSGMYYVAVESIGQEPQKYTLKINVAGGS